MTKKILLTMAIMATATSLMAKDIKTMKVTTTPVMHCESCENNIKSNIRFVKGVKDIQTSVPDQCVTITYDADKASFKTIEAGFKKINYDIKEIAPKAAEDNANGHQCTEQGDNCCKKAQTADSDCCKKEQAAKKDCCEKEQAEHHDCKKM